MACPIRPVDTQIQLDLSRTLTALAPALGVEEIRHYPPARWTVAFDATLIVDLDFDPPSGQLVLSAELGQPPAGEELAVYKLLLEVNQLWEQTGGLRMALDPARGRLKQIYAVTLAGLEPEALIKRLGNFAVAAHAWRAVVVTPPDRPIDPLLLAYPRA